MGLGVTNVVYWGGLFHPSNAPNTQGQWIAEPFEWGAANVPSYQTNNSVFNETAVAGEYIWDSTNHAYIWKPDNVPGYTYDYDTNSWYM